MELNNNMPEVNKNAFICPHCGVFAQMRWEHSKNNEYIPIPKNYCFHVGTCTNCGNVTIWNYDKMIEPATSNVVPPSIDMPIKVKELYNEARDIVNKSPRGAAALLRLALDKLCDEICVDCKKKKKIDDKISILVAQGLTDKLQKAFDFVRITGNDAVHELGLINIQDNPEIANTLFALLNFIAEKMITENKQIDNLYNLIPETRRDKIEERNKKAKGVNNA